jgi:DNA-binding NtrC family response regulator
MEPPFPSLAPVPPPITTPWILIVDDEAALLNLIETILQAEGWTTFLADSGEKALAALKAAKHPPALFICDVMMPRIDGLELTRRMLARVPGLKVILISGHLTDLSWWPTDMREHRFLSKPFSNDDLVAAVREALADGQPIR